MALTFAKIAALAAAAALIVTPAGAAVMASSSLPPSAASSAPSPSSSWTALGVMSSASSSSATAAAVQDYDEDRGVGGIPLPVLGVWLLTLGVFIWILTQDDDDGGFALVPNSPN